MSSSRGRHWVFVNVIFFKKMAVNLWQYHKVIIEANTLIPPIQVEFKIFLQKKLKKTRVIVDDI